MEKENGVRRKMRAFYDAMGKNRSKNIIIFILLLTTLFGAYQYNRAVLLRRQLNNTYNRAFYELVDYVSNVEILLLKTLMTSSPEMTVTTLRDVCQEARAAASNLSQLPVSVGVLSNTEKFLSQVSDLTQSLARKTTAGMGIDDKQLETLSSLHSFALKLEENLNELKNELENGNFKWENVMHEGTKTFSEASSEMPMNFSTIDQSFEEMPTLIYDGPFSEHMQKRQPLGLTGQNISEEKAIEKLGEFLGKDKINNVTKLADNNNEIINTYNFKIELAGKKDYSIAEADVSVKGGHVVWYLYNRVVGEPTIDINKAKQIGKEFLDSRGYPNMKDTYYFEAGGIATINYAYTDEDGITYYPDLIKVKIALDNGEVVGFEAKGYLMNHTKRNLGKPKLTQEEARAKVLRGENIKASGLAVIPTNYGTEILCYEFIGKLKEKDFLVYINANTGAEEQVLLIINTEDGVLTM